jgi:hypothetical protein
MGLLRHSWLHGKKNFVIIWSIVFLEDKTFLKFQNFEHFHLTYQPSNKCFKFWNDLKVDLAFNLSNICIWK